MTTQNIIDCWQSGVEPYRAAKAERAAQRAAFADHVYAASERFPLMRDGACTEVRDACINESKNEVEVEP